MCSPVLLRSLRPDDRRDLFRLLSDPQVYRFMLFPMFTEADAESFVRRFDTLAEPRGAPPQLVAAIVREPRLIGLCGLVLDGTGRQGELWYLIDPEAWGTGAASEAARAMVTLGFRDCGLHRIWARCVRENPASARVLEKAGFRREGFHPRSLLVHGVWRDATSFALLQSEWPPPIRRR